MLRVICLSFAILLFGPSQEVNGQNKQQEGDVLVIYNGWTLYTPKGFTCKGDYSIDSYMGTISSKKDSIKLQFDISPSRAMTKYQGNNCTLEQMSGMAKLFLDSDSLMQALRVTNTSHAYIDTINGRIAIVIIPQNIGKGETRILIIDCPSLSSLSLTSKDLNAEQQELVLTMFKTINRIKRSD